MASLFLSKENVMQDAWEAQQAALEELSIPKIHELKAIPEQLERLQNEFIAAHLKANAEPIEPDRYKEPFVYYEPAEGTGGLPAVICTCGWSKHHLRFKILQRAAEKHYLKTGHNTHPTKE